MIHLAVFSSQWYHITAVLLAALLFRQVITSSSESYHCHPEQCEVNEFCCDGLCCTYFGSNWYAWLVLVLLLFTIVITCLYFPPFPCHKESSQPVHYHFFTCEGNDVPCTKPYQQQPQVPQYHSFATETSPQQFHPYRYERLVQQSSPRTLTYPDPSAPPSER